MNISPNPVRQTAAGGVFAVLYGCVAYAVFFATFLYAVGFVGNLFVPKSVDSGSPASLFETLNVNLALLALFAVQHSVMARPAFKRWWTRIVPVSIERSTYVLLASAVLILLFWQWRPILTPVWTVTNDVTAALLQSFFWLGWGMVLLSTFLINHFELFGLRQVFARLLGRTLPQAQFRTPFLYQYTRHPLYLGFLIAFWSAPTMTAGHLLFAAGSSMYILLGIFLEERDLIDAFGDRYHRYRQDVHMLLPIPKGRKSNAPRHGVARTS
jgi:protein-S-isoprenylcysteine O-methyltransferase Ste14